MRELQVAEQLYRGKFDQIYRISQMTMVYSLVDRREDEERMFALLEEQDRSSTVGEAVWALAYLALHNYDQAYQQIEAAMEKPSSRNNTTLIEIKANPWSISELDTPRFQEILSRLWQIE